MPVSMCSKCRKMISISNVPGGNPMAKANPGMWALAYGVCDRCKSIFCDKCIESNAGKCPNCGRKIEVKK